MPLTINFTCYACLTRLIDKTTTRCFVNQDHRLKATKELLNILSKMSPEQTAPEIAAAFFHHIRQEYGIIDPYHDEKK